jgi:mono/diheme cytochrome c family protein
MRTTVMVVSPERFEEFIKEQQKGIRAGNEAAEKVEAKKLKDEAAANPSAESSEEGEEAGSQTEESEEAEAESAAGEEGEAEQGEAEGGEGEEPAEAGGEEAAEGESEGGATADAAAGKEVFAENCSVCHGSDGLGGSGGPDLTTMPKAKEQAGAEEQVTNGGGGMPAFAGTLSEEEIANVAAYVVEDIVGGK